MTGQLETLAEWLTAEKVTLVGMESTGIYWKPVYYLLEDMFPVWVINAEHLRNVPGRKTDVADSMWIAQLIEHGLVSPSFVPPPGLLKVPRPSSLARALKAPMSCGMMSATACGSSATV